jgi:hypothetical protein
MRACRYEKMDPTRFKVGDVVAAQVSFVRVPIKGGKVKLMIVLRALTLLDCQQSMVRLLDLFGTLG